jgi:creatinine amidohydrolase
MHAGHSETALMLALAPETVHMERAVANFPPVFPSKLLSQDGRPACAWTARDFGPSGVIGDPHGATREQGDEILDTLSDSWVTAITDLFHMEWVVRDVPSWGHVHQRGHIESGTR